MKTLILSSLQQVVKHPYVLTDGRHDKLIIKVAIFAIYITF